MAANPVKRAASLILCKQSKKMNTFYDYQILMLCRKDSMKSWNSVLAFPGGKIQLDKDQLLKSNLSLQSLTVAAALRQCFEETGLYLPKDPIVQTTKISDLNQIKLEYIAAQFHKHKAIISQSHVTKQQNISSSQIQKNQYDTHMFKFFQKLTHIVPPKTNLLPFVRLVAVPLLKIRFDAYFYVQKLEEFKLINFFKYAQHQKYLHSQQQIVMNQQFSSFGWFTPIEVLRGFVEKKIKLAPPQFIMLNIMASFHKYNELNQFLKKCSHNQINMGPNIVSVINNKGYLKQTYPYAATLLGDLQFPYQFCLKSQKNKYLVDEIEQSKTSIGNLQEKRKNRMLFKKPLQFFEDDYDNQCQIQNSVMSKFINSKKLRQTLQNYQ